MITSLREDEIDIAIGLTEGWIAGLVGKDQMAKNDGAGAGGYKMIGQWVETPLRWAIVTGRDRDEIQGVEDLKGGRVGVSRLGRYAFLWLTYNNQPCSLLTSPPADHI